MSWSETRIRIIERTSGRVRGGIRRLAGPQKHTTPGEDKSSYSNRKKTTHYEGYIIARPGGESREGRGLAQSLGKPPEPKDKMSEEVAEDAIKGKRVRTTYQWAVKKGEERL